MWCWSKASGLPNSVAAVRTPLQVPFPLQSPLEGEEHQRLWLGTRWHPSPEDRQGASPPSRLAAVNENALGIAEITLRRARQALGVRVRREGFGKEGRFLLALPSNGCHAADGATQPWSITRPHAATSPLSGPAKIS